MGTTLDRINELYWLGRYLERVYAMLKMYIDGYDRMIDIDEDYYIEICDLLGIPNTYTSKESFIESFGFDEANCYSIAANLNRAYDNTMLLRDEIGTSTLSYIHLAISELQIARDSAAPMLEIQRTVDDILAFWGCLDDEVAERAIRDTVKSGKRVERLDIYLRRKKSRDEIQGAVGRLTARLESSELNYDRAALMYLTAMAEEQEIDHSAMSAVIAEEKLVSVKSDCAGFFEPLVDIDMEVTKGQPMARLLDPCESFAKSEVTAPVSGRVFFVQTAPMPYEGALLFKILPQ